MKMKNGYTDYKEIVGNRLDVFIQKNKITKKNARKWLTFARMLQSDGVIIENLALLKIGILKYGKVIKKNAR